MSDWEELRREIEALPEYENDETRNLVDRAAVLAAIVRAVLSGSTAPLDELSVMADALDYSMGPERRRRLAADVLEKLNNAGYHVARLAASPDPAQPPEDV